MNEVREESKFLQAPLRRSGVSVYRHRTMTQGFIAFLGLMWMLVADMNAAELPPSLSKAIAQVQAGEGEKASGVLRRFAFTDDPEQRLAARTMLAELDRMAGRLDRALSWVEDYQIPQAENYQWPRVRAHVEAAKIHFARGNAFESIKRLLDAKEKSTGIAKVTVERALSWVVELKPDLSQALEYEKAALKTGEGHFKRKRISETAGLEPEKPYSVLWKNLKPEIEARIEYLKRKIDIDKYGLDYVLYREAQEFRNASHPLAMDFTNVAAAFGEEGEIGGVVPDADYKMAVERYKEILQFFPDNPFGQAAKFYVAVCTAKAGGPEGAIRQLKDFYKEDPDGLYRGEALLVMGDIYLFTKWDKANAREAYERVFRWAAAVESRTRVLETYLPEKSIEVSKPPKTYKLLTPKGVIKEIPVPENALVNRLTSDWYLNMLIVESQWRLGFLALIDEDWDSAFQYFDQTLHYDSVVKKAHQGRFFNPYDRLKMGRENGAIVGTPEQSKGLDQKVKTALYWADLNFMLEDFQEALSLYKRVQYLANGDKDWNAYARSVLGEMLIKRQISGLDPVPDITRMHELVMRHPRSPSAPYLLELCALSSRGEPLPAKAYFEQIYTQYPDSTFFAVRARYNEILRCVPWHETEKRREKITKFKSDYPNRVDYIQSLEDLDKKIIAWQMKQKK